MEINHSSFIANKLIQEWSGEREDRSRGKIERRVARENRVSDSHADTKRYAILIMGIDNLITYQLLAAYRAVYLLKRRKLFAKCLK